MTVTEFKAILQKNLDEVVWRDKGWGPIPIHGKGEKGFSVTSRIAYNKEQIASGKLSKEGTAKKQEVIKELEKKSKRLEKAPEAWNMTHKEWIDTQRDIIKGNMYYSSYGEPIKFGDKIEYHDPFGKHTGTLVNGKNDMLVSPYRNVKVSIKDDDTKKTIEVRNASEYNVRGKRNDEYFDRYLDDPTGNIAHRKLVSRAISAGKSIPDKVLAEYPDLKELTKKK